MQEKLSIYLTSSEIEVTAKEGVVKNGLQSREWGAKTRQGLRLIMVYVSGREGEQSKGKEHI